MCCHLLSHPSAYVLGESHAIFVNFQIQSVPLHLCGRVGAILSANNAIVSSFLRNSQPTRLKSQPALKMVIRYLLCPPFVLYTAITFSLKIDELLW